MVGTVNHPAWLRRRSAAPGIDWSFLAYWCLVGGFIGVGVVVLGYRLSNLAVLDRELLDSSLYLRATEAWLNRGNPWAVHTSAGVYFAGLPTTLLLSLPLVPFGSTVATWFWLLAGLAGWLLVMRSLGLPPWWILFPPFIEGWLSGSPDPALAGLVMIGGGVIAVAAKPYAIPALAGERRWRSLAAGAIIGLVTVPVLPWGSFMDQIGDVGAALNAQSSAMSAWGTPVLMVVVAASLLALGPRLGLLLATPALWPSAQLHYSLFSARAGVDSAFLGLVLAIPRAAPFGVVAYALATKLLPVVAARYRAVREGPTK
jgi:hypothetical protein